MKLLKLFKRNKLKHKYFSMLLNDDGKWSIIYRRGNSDYVDIISVNGFKVNVNMFKQLLTTAKHGDIQNTDMIKIRDGFNFKMTNNNAYLYLHYNHFKSKDVDKFISICEHMIEQINIKDMALTKQHNDTEVLVNKFQLGDNQNETSNCN